MCSLHLTHPWRAVGSAAPGDQLQILSQYFSQGYWTVFWWWMGNQSTRTKPTQTWGEHANATLWRVMVKYSVNSSGWHQGRKQTRHSLFLQHLTNNQNLNNRHQCLNTVMTEARHRTKWQINSKEMLGQCGQSTKVMKFFEGQKAKAKGPLWNSCLCYLLI